MSINILTTNKYSKQSKDWYLEPVNQLSASFNFKCFVVILVLFIYIMFSSTNKIRRLECAGVSGAFMNLGKNLLRFKNQINNCGDQTKQELGTSHQD